MPRFHSLAALLGLVACIAAARADDSGDALARRGQRLFLRCASCHQTTDGAVVKTGPLLKGIVGRKAASVAGFDYSKSLSALSFDWDEAHLDAWIERPTALAPGTTMAFEGLPSSADRQAVIAYLKTLR
jgi:cytochrome c